MTVFKAVLKILNKNKFIILLYTVFLIGFSGFNIEANDNTGFSENKPRVMIVNNDPKSIITNNLVKYIKKNSEIVNLGNDETKINDGLFYRDINYVIYIPYNYGLNFLNGKNPDLEIKSVGDLGASISEMTLKRYLKVANTLLHITNNEQDLTVKINEALENEVNVELTTKLKTEKLEKMNKYYNFASYSILASLIYIICIVLASFRNEHVSKRIIISSTDYKKHNFYLLLSNASLALILWILYAALCLILVGDIVLTKHGLLYLFNSFVFTFCAVTIAFVVVSFITNKDSIGGVVNVIALGFSFLCGAFIPVDFLPKGVLKVAHTLPAFYYVDANEKIKTLETFNLISLKPIFLDMIIVLGFSLIFIIVTNIVTKKKQKIG